jgi:hypothetical protein
MLWAGMRGRSAILQNFWLQHSSLFNQDRVAEIVELNWPGGEDDEDYGVGEAGMDTSSNRILLDPVFLAEIQPIKSKKGMFDRFK